MYRGISLKPAGVPVHLIFDESVPAEFIAAVKDSWASMNPQEFRTNPRSPQDLSHTVLITAQESPVPDPGPDTVIRVNDTAEAQEQLTVAITFIMLKKLAGRLSLFHAAALGNAENHRALLLIGPSGRGKTTASRFLGRHLTYLSDETAVVDRHLHIRPYPKPLSIIETKGKPKAQYDPAKLGMNVAGTGDFSYRLTRIVLLDRSPKPCTPSLEPVALADSLLEIVQQTSGLAQTTNGIQRLIELVQDCGGTLRLTYHEIADTLGLVQQLLAGETTMVADQETVQYCEEPEHTPLDATKIQRAPGTSGYLIGQRLLLYRDSELSEVSAFAADSWRLLNTPLPAAELKKELEKIYGEIPPQEFTLALESLRAGGVVR